MSRKCTMPSVLIVDSLNLRRAAISFLLKDWASANDLTIGGIEPSEWPPESTTQGLIKLVIYVAGATPVRSDRNLIGIQNVLIKSSSAPLVIVTDNDDGQDIVAAIHAGARAYVSTSMDPAFTQRVLTFVLEGGTYFPPDFLLRGQDPSVLHFRTLITQPTDKGSAVQRGSLTNRQMEVASLLRHGMSNKTIARNLDMAEATVKVHVRQIMRKLGVHNRTQAALFSSENEPGSLSGASTYRLHN